MPSTHARIAFELEQDEDGYPPVSVETLWALPTPEGFWRIDNIPFFVYGIALDDIIEAHGDPLTFVRVVQPGGHATLRMLLSKTADAAPLRAALNARGCSSEASHIPTLFAVDVPPAVDVAEVRAFLEGCEEVEEVEDGCERE